MASFPRQNRPRFLSPIQETEEDKNEHQATKEAFSAIDMGSYSTLQGFDFPSFSNDALDTPSRAISGRKREEVEVLKQKYMNKDIQDLPRLMLGPVRYGRLHRSRTPLNLGSRDIQTQLSKLRQRMQKFSTTMMQEKKPSFRHARQPQQSFRSQLLSRKPNSDSNFGDIVDDFEPELVALFENYIDERDQLQKRCTDVTQNTAESDATTGTAASGQDERYPTHSLDPDAKQAYMYGFLQGLNHQILKDPSAAIPKQPQSDPDASPCVGNQDFRDLIVNNQDVTHKYLREWEHDFSHSASSKEYDSDQAEFSHLSHRRSVNQSGSQCDTSAQGSKSLTSISGTQSLSGSSIAMAIPRIDFPVQFQKPMAHLVDLQGKQRPFKSKDGSTIHETGKQKCYSQTNEVRDPIIIEDSRKNGYTGACAIGRQEPEGEEQPLDFSQLNQEYMYTVYSVGRRSTTDDNSCGRNENIVDNRSTTRPRGKFASMTSFNFSNPLNEEQLSIVKLAKKKLENKFMSSLTLEEMYMNSVRGKRVQKDCRVSSAQDSKRQTVKRAVTSDKVGQVLDNLDGWTIESKHTDDVDGLHFSVSDILHPVDSSEKVPCHTPASNKGQDTPIIADNELLAEQEHSSCLGTVKLSSSEFKHREREDLKSVSNNVVSTEKNQSEPPQDIAVLSVPSDRSRDSQGSKPPRSVASVPSDYKKVMNFVKLRLTRSTPSVGNSSDTKRPKSDKDTEEQVVKNNPMPQCTSYNIERNLKASLTATSSINLSETLARQLKDLSQNIQKTRASNLQLSYTALSSGKKSPIKIDTKPSPSSSDRELPVITGSRLTASSSVSKDKVDTCHLPDISVSNESPTKQKYMIHRQRPQLGNENDVTELPPICVTPLSCRTPNRDQSHDVSRALDLLDTNFKRGSTPVRFGLCSSPYMFDKDDPEKLQVKAKQLQNQHTVCTCCGIINETDDTQRKGSKHGRGQKKTDPKPFTKRIHKKCSDTCIEDTWMLEKSLVDSGNNEPVSVKKLSRDHGCSSKTQTNSHKMRSAETVNTNTSKHSQRKCEEMAIRFMDQDIKVRFHCEVSLEKCGSSGKSDKPGRWLENMAAPICREKLECPVAAETRIYMEKPKRPSKQVLEFHQDSRTKVTDQKSSPYVEYCRRQAAKRNSATERCHISDYLPQGICVKCLGGNAVNNLSGHKKKHGSVCPLEKQLSKHKHDNGRCRIADNGQGRKKRQRSVIVPLGQLPHVSSQDDVTDITIPFDKNWARQTMSTRCPIAPCNSLSTVTKQRRKKF